MIAQFKVACTPRFCESARENFERIGLVLAENEVAEVPGKDRSPSGSGQEGDHIKASILLEEKRS